MKLTLRHADQNIPIDLDLVDETWTMRADEGADLSGQWNLEGSRFCVQIDGRKLVVGHAARTDRGIEVCIEGRSYLFTVPKPGARAASTESHTGEICTPMVGVLASVLVSEGEEVSERQPVATVEAMKVVATLEAPFAGRVASLTATQGDRLSHGQVIMVIEPY